MSKEKEEKAKPAKQEYSVCKTGKVVMMFPKDAEALIRKGVIQEGKTKGKKAAEA